LIRRPIIIVTILTVVALSALTHASPTGMRLASGAGQEAAPAPQPPSADSMLNAWQSFAGLLEPEAMQKIGRAFDGEERTSWAYIPQERVGLPLGEMDDKQRDKLRDLLRSGLGPGGFERVQGVIGLEEVLFAQSGRSATRDPGLYFVINYGVPSTSGPWGWRFEGHHLSVNFTVLDNQIVSGTPAFFGASPAHVADDAEVSPGLRPLGVEQDLGLQLVGSFEGELGSQVIIAAAAPDDILTSNSPTAEMGPPEGVAYADMSEQQQALMLELLGSYAARMNPALAEYQMAKIRQAGIERLHFAWAGGTEPGEKHYYRIQGPTFVVEWDNTQDDANHVHSVWRDFGDDFGRDPLRRHLALDHGLRHH